MTFDLAVWPATSPGWGHMMRCYALAEEAIARGLGVVVVLDTYKPEAVPLGAAVSLARSEPPSASVLIVDGLPPNEFPCTTWAIVDSVEERDEWDLAPCDGIIYPHYGATPAQTPTLCGPEYMPLRSAFVGLRVPRPKLGYGIDGRFHYKAPAKYAAEAKDLAGAGFDAHKLASWLAGASEVIVPPSTIAYEAMVCGVPVRLHDRFATPANKAVGKAMVEAGVARWVTDDGPTSMYPRHDGAGAERILRFVS